MTDDQQFYVERKPHVERRQAVKVGWLERIEPGHLLQAGLVACGIIIWAVTKSVSADNAQHDLDSLKTTVSAEFEKIRNAQEKTKEDLLREIRQNPSVEAHFTNIEKWISAQEAIQRDRDARLMAVETKQYQLGLDLGSLTRSSNVPLRTAR